MKVRYMKPDEELKTLIKTRTPEHIYNQLPASVVDLVCKNEDIPLSANWADGLDTEVVENVIRWSELREATEELRS